MAIGPQTNNRAKRLEQLEKKIDSYLKKGDERVTIDTTLLQITHAEWVHLKPKYIKAGWKTAEYVSDQRDGDYLDFNSGE